MELIFLSMFCLTILTIVLMVIPFEIKDRKLYLIILFILNALVFLFLLNKIYLIDIKQQQIEYRLRMIYEQGAQQ